MNKQRWIGVVRGGLIALALSLEPMSGLAAGTSEAPPKPEAGVAAAKPMAEPVPPLSEILTGIETREAVERRLRLLLTDEKRVRALAAEIEEIERAFSGIRKLAGVVLSDVVGFHELVDLGNTLRTADHRLTRATDELAAKAKTLDVGLDRVTAAGARTAGWMQTADKRKAPAGLVERLQALTPRTEALARELQAHRDLVLEVLGKATHLRGAVTVLRHEISERRDQIATELRAARVEPIWRLEIQREEHSRVIQFLDVQIAQSFRHMRDHAALLLAIATVAFALTYWLIVATSERLAAQAQTDPYARRIGNLFRVPAVAAVLAALVAVMVFGPQGPFNYELMLWALSLLPAVLLARATVGPQISLSLYTLAVALISQALFGALVDPLPLASRVLLIAQCAATAVALGVDLSRGHFRQTFPRLPATLVRWVVVAMIFLLAFAVLATLTGHLGAARVLRAVVLGSVGLALLVAMMVGLLYGLILTLMQTSAGRSLRIVRTHQDAMRTGLRRLLMAIGSVAWVLATVLMLGWGDEASSLADALVQAEFTIGSTNIDLSDVWAGLAVILGTLVLVKIAGPVLEVEILPRLMRREGLPFAVSAVTRYLLITAGALLAMAAMGIDLTKVTLLAGALGVGIGFGLQGVVNNFVSGLILLTERPVNVGDVVQLGQLRGVIRRIGVRSSTVQTSQGAEVIVPNADLISKEVTNWTLSDRRRRLDIEVGVAYGTAPELVVQLLEAAAREVAEVLADPPPSASLRGFGDSSLNFRLEAWIDNYSRGGITESALRMAIAKRFEDANIEIPFPQRDLHIRTVPVAPASQGT